MEEEHHNTHEKSSSLSEEIFTLYVGFHVSSGHTSDATKKLAISKYSNSSVEKKFQFTSQLCLNVAFTSVSFLGILSTISHISRKMRLRIISDASENVIFNAEMQICKTATCFSADTERIRGNVFSL